MKTIKKRTLTDTLLQIWRRVWWWVAVQRDMETGKLFYVRNGKRIFVNNRRDFPLSMRYAFEDVIFKPYRPRAGDTVVDIGAGYGEEAAFLGDGIKYFAVDCQPSTYECLATTAREFPLMRAIPFAVAEAPIYLSVSRHNESAAQGGYIEVPNLAWRDFLSRYQIGAIDLLKINIEGGEADFLEHADLANVKRIVVCCHDFRADRGDGEHYRSYERVAELLKARGFSMSQITDTGPDWARWWFYCEPQSPSTHPA